MTLDPADAFAELVDLGLQSSCLLELASGARGCKCLVDNESEGNDPLWAVDARHHPQGHSSAAVPGTKGRARYAGGRDGLLEGDPTLFDWVAGEVVKEPVPAIARVSPSGWLTMRLRSVVEPPWPTLLSDRALDMGPYDSHMFERFTDRARRVIVVAQDAARDMGHAQIKPEHLLVGLQQGEGMAAKAITQAGVDGATLRERVAALYERLPSAKKIDKVPFSVEGKKCLEQSLRAALALGHNYIGTEHIFFGVQRQAEANDKSLDELLGVNASEISRRLTEMLAGATAGPAMRSPALGSALERARARLGQLPMTTGHVLDEMLADPESQVSHALSALGMDPHRVQAALDAVSLAERATQTPRRKASPSRSAKGPLSSPTRTLQQPSRN